MSRHPLLLIRVAAVEVVGITTATLTTSSTTKTSIAGTEMTLETAVDAVAVMMGAEVRETTTSG